MRCLWLAMAALLLAAPVAGQLSVDERRQLEALRLDALRSVARVDSVLAGTLPPDRVAPTVTLVAPAASARVSGFVMLEANVTDDRRVTRVSFRINGAEVGADTLAPFQFQWWSRAVPNSIVQYTVSGTDGAGNVRLSVVRSLTVSNATLAPMPALDSMRLYPFPLPSTTVGDSVSIQAGLWAGGLPYLCSRIVAGGTVEAPAGPFGFWPIVVGRTAGDTLRVLGSDATREFRPDQRCANLLWTSSDSTVMRVEPRLTPIPPPGS